MLKCGKMKRKLNEQDEEIQNLVEKIIEQEKEVELLHQRLLKKEGECRKLVKDTEQRIR